MSATASLFPAVSLGYPQIREDAGIATYNNPTDSQAHMIWQSMILWCYLLEVDVANLEMPQARDIGDSLLTLATGSCIART